MIYYLQGYIPASNFPYKKLKREYHEKVSLELP